MEKIRKFIESHNISYRDLAAYMDITYSVLARHVTGKFKDKSGKMKGKILLALDKYISDQRIRVAEMRAQYSIIYSEEYPQEQ